jgi:uncharacterized protein (TIGR02996 family)
MDEEKLLLRAILAEPNEDTPRLMMADFLDERGEGDDGERAEFIRVGIELAQYTPPIRIRVSEVLDEVTGLDGPTELTVSCSHSALEGIVRSGAFDGNKPIPSVAVDVLTSRVTADTHCDFKIHQVRDEDGPGRRSEIVLKKCPPWPDRARYNHLLNRQHRLLNFKEEGPTPWTMWAFVPHWNADGNPCEPNGRGGMTVYPAHEQFPEVCVPPRIHQRFKRGFVDSIRTNTKDFFEYCEAIFAEHPVVNVELADRWPIRAFTVDGPFNGGNEPWTWWGEGNGPDSHAIPQQLTGAIDPESIPEWLGDRPAFNTREEAVAFLSELSVRFGRKKAGIIK